MLFYRLSWFVVTPPLRALWRVRAEGKEHLPKKGAAILASNHLSFLDHFLLGASVWRPIYYISKIEHFERPIRRWFFSRWGVIPLRRGASDRDAFEASLDVLRGGHVFCIYPEGTRSLDGRLHKGHTGVARLHLLSGAPIVPVAMTGTFKALPKGATRPRLTKCGVRFGAPLSYTDQGLDPGNRDALRRVTDDVMRAIQRLSHQEYVDEYQYNPEVKTHARVAGDEANGRPPGETPTRPPTQARPR